MRVYGALIGCLISSLVSASEMARVEGVPVYGRRQLVEPRAIRAAIEDGAHHGDVVKAEVLGRYEIKVHLRRPQ
jgi:hypothetical protein